MLRFLSANKIFNQTKFLQPNSIIVIESNIVKEITSKAEVPNDKIEIIDGIIAPGFINAHCHTELSHLKEKINVNTGLIEFAKNIIKKRNEYTLNEIEKHIFDADELMYKNGIVAVGDICNTSHSLPIKKRSKIYYHNFIEIMGLNPIHAEHSLKEGLKLHNLFLNNGQKASVAPHAPYSTSLELISQIEKHNGTIVSTIHNQESEEETLFFNGENSKINDLYNYLNISINFFKAPKSSSLNYYYPYFKNKKNILVHNTFTKKTDIEFTNDNVYWCFCPNANLYIENSLPNYKAFQKLMSHICIGTDSLASNTSLDVCSEINTILNHTNIFSIEQLLQAATYNGAKALQINDVYGSIKGNITSFNVLTFKNNKLKFISKLK